MLICFFLARLNIIGEPLYNITKLILPIYLPNIDNPTFIIPINLSFSKDNSDKNITIKNGDTLFSGEKINITFSSGKNCWLSFFCIDSKGTHELFQGTFEPNFISEKSEYINSFILDDTEGVDVFYIGSSPNRVGRF